MARLTLIGSIAAVTDSVAASLVSGATQTRAAVDARIDSRTQSAVSTAVASSQAAKDAAVAAMNDAAVKAALAYQRAPVSSGSLDDLKTEGVYPITSKSGVTGLPVPEAGRLTVQSGTYITQEYLTWQISPRLYTRTLINGVWQPWTPMGWVKGVIPAGDSLDTYRTSGLYEIAATSVASVGGRPSTAGPQWSVLEVVAMTGTSGTVRQTMWQYDGDLTRKWERNAPTLGAAFREWVELTTALLPSKTSVACLGDSLTQGYGPDAGWPAADAYPAKLATELGITVQNFGRTSDTSDMVLIRTGLHRLRFKVVGGVIPADTSAVTLTTSFKHDWPGDIYFAGNLNGIFGTLRIAAGVWTFTRSAAGTAVTTATADFIGSQPLSASTVTVWFGRNDLAFGNGGMEGDSVSHVVANYQAVVERLTATHKNVMLFGVTSRVDDTVANGRLTRVNEVNDRLRQLFPGKFADVQKYLVTKAIHDVGLTPTAEDTTAMQEGRIPPALYNTGDVTHFTKPTAAALAKYFVAPYLRGKGWVL